MDFFLGIEFFILFLFLFFFSFFLASYDVTWFDFGHHEIKKGEKGWVGLGWAGHCVWFVYIPWRDGGASMYLELSVDGYTPFFFWLKKDGAGGRRGGGLC